MENINKSWIIVVIISIAVILGVIVGMYAYQKGNISEMNTLNTQKLAGITNEEKNDNEELVNEAVETSSINKNISPNAIIIQKRYYQGCDHLIREIMDIPENLVNKTEEDFKKEYADWKLEGYSPTEIVIYKEFKGICDEHYVVKEHNGVLGIYTENSEGIQEWKEDTEIETQYLPNEDVKNFEIGVKVVGKTNLNSFLEDYE